MWKDIVQERYWWARIEDQLDELIYELSKAEEEEATLLYLMGLYQDDSLDLQFFTEEECQKVRQLLSILMDYSLKHRDMLSELLEGLDSKKRNPHARAAI